MRCEVTERVVLTQKELNTFYDFYSLIGAIEGDCTTEEARELARDILKNLDTLDEDYLVGEGM